MSMITPKMNYLYRLFHFIEYFERQFAKNRDILRFFIMNFDKILFLQIVVHKLLYSTVEVLFLLIIFVVVNEYTHICTMIEVISKQE